LEQIYKLLRFVVNYVEITTEGD